MCKHQFRDRQAHHSPSGINKLAVCRSQLDQRTQGQHMDALHFTLTAEQTTTEDVLLSYLELCLPNRWQNLSQNLESLPEKYIITSLVRKGSITGKLNKEKNSSLFEVL